MAQNHSDCSVLLCLDFDGTLTNREGSALVFTDFFKSFMKVPSRDYKHSPFKSKQEIQAIFEEKFGNPFDYFNSYDRVDSDVLISQGAWNFLKEALKHTAVSINIITKNRADYIRHVLTYQGFTEAEVSRINVNDSGYKDDATREFVEMYKPEFAIICDDSEFDANNMKNGVQTFIKDDNKIALYHKKPGQFNWDLINQSLERFISQANQSSFPPNIHPVLTSNSERERYDFMDGTGLGPHIPQNKNKFFTPKVFVPSVLSLGLALGAVTTGLLGIHLAAPIVLGVLAALAAILAITMLVKQTSNTYTQI